MFDCFHISVPGAEKETVKPQKERTQERNGVLRRFMPGPDRFEKGSAEDRRQDQGYDHGKEHGGNQGHGKLAIDNARGAAEECHGTEDRREHETDANESARDLLHRFCRGFPRR